MSLAVNTMGMLRAIASHASPVLVAQLASMSTTLVDTFITGRVSTLDLAAVGIGSGVYISVMLAGAGIVQGLTPVAAQHYGAGRHEALPATFQQGIWLALMLGFAGMLLLLFPDWILGWSGMSPEVDARTRAYLSVLALCMPGTLVYRACGGMLNALGRPRMLMFFGLGNACTHILLAPALALGWLGHAPLGAVGCALSALCIYSVLPVLALGYLARSSATRELQLLRHWQGPRWAQMREQLLLGLPIGMSAFVEITSFALIALLVAQLGPVAAGSHRVIGNFGGLCYMLPLSISIATLALVGQAAGAQDERRVRKTVRAGLLLGMGSSTLLGLVLWVFGDSLIRAYTPDPAVQALSISLIGLVGFYQLFDALQTVAAQALRGLKIATAPMLIHVFCFWVIGLGGGWLLCYHGLPGTLAPMGLGGFWWAATLATVAAGGLFWWLLRRTLRQYGKPTPAAP